MQRLAIFVFVLGVPILAFATDNYEYGVDEYVTIAKGISPDGRFAITAHGEGEFGYEHFHLYLADAHTGKNIGPLEEITKILDTGAGAYVAKWSEDSKIVTVAWRWSRQAPLLSITYRIVGTRVVPLTKAPVDSNGLSTYWRKNCSDSQPTPRRFGAQKAHE